MMLSGFFLLGHSLFFYSSAEPIRSPKLIGSLMRVYVSETSPNGFMSLIWGPV